MGNAELKLRCILKTFTFFNIVNNTTVSKDVLFHHYIDIIHTLLLPIYTKCSLLQCITQQSIIYIFVQDMLKRSAFSVPY